jgi:hypothetical protein
MGILKQLGFISPGHAYVQNAHRGHFELGANLNPRNQLLTPSPNSLALFDLGGRLG